MSFIFIITLISSLFISTAYESVDNNESYLDNNRKLRTSSVKFVAYPHQRVFDGFLDYGEFIAGDLQVIKSKLSYMDYNNLDHVQDSAIREGIFFPNRENFPKFHIFSSDELFDCIRGKKIYFFGDSYSRQMFIGMSDILLGNPSNNEILNGKMRDVVVLNTTNVVNAFLGDKATMKLVLNQCNHGDLNCIIQGIKDDVDIVTADAFIGNILIHHIHMHKEDNSIDGYLEQLQTLFTSFSNLKLTWVTGPSYNISLVPEAYKEATKKRPTTYCNFEALKLGTKHNIPVIDIFSLTHSCKWRNCSYDGGHRSRHVNRMKAQMLLNNLCSINI